MCGLKNIQKTLLAVLISASLSVSLSACNGSSDSAGSTAQVSGSDNGTDDSDTSVPGDSSGDSDTSVPGDSSDDEELSSYGSAAEKADLFSSYTGSIGENVQDPLFPVYSESVYINLSDLSFSTDDVTYASIDANAVTTVTDGITISSSAGGYISLDATGKSGTVRYVLTGTLDRGTVDITAGKNASLVIELNGVDIRSGNNPAITVSPKTSTAFVDLKGTNYLTDGRVFGIGYSESNGTDYYDTSVDSSVDVSDAELTRKWAKGADDNGVLSTKGMFRISGDGILNISTAYKHGIYAKNRIYMYGGEIGIRNSGRNGLQSKNGIDIIGGTLNIEGVGTHTNKQSRGIIVSGDESSDGAGLGGISIAGGVINIETVGKAVSAKWDIDEDAETSDTSDDPNPVVSVSGGTVNITTTGEIIDDDMNPHFVSYYDEDGILTTEYESCSPEGIEGKLGVEISGGTLNVVTTDDALNASRDGDAYINISGGNLYLRATEADAIDSNGDINISGGVIVAVASLGSEDGFDCDGRLAFTGGLAVGVSGSNHDYAGTGASVTTQNTFVLGSSYMGSQNTVMAVKDSSGNTVFAYRLPSSSFSLATMTTPAFAGTDTYSIYTGVNVSGGSEFNGLYIEMPQVSGGTLKGSVTVTDASHVYTLTQGNGGNSGPGGFPGGGR